MQFFLQFIYLPLRQCWWLSRHALSKTSLSSANSSIWNAKRHFLGIGRNVRRRDFLGNLENSSRTKPLQKTHFAATFARVHVSDTKFLEDRASHAVVRPQRYMNLCGRDCRCCIPKCSLVEILHRDSRAGFEDGSKAPFPQMKGPQQIGHSCCHSLHCCIFPVNTNS